MKNPKSQISPLMSESPSSPDKFPPSITLVEMTFKKRLAGLVTNRIFEFSLIVTIIIYSLIVFTSFAIEDLSKKDNNPAYEQVLLSLMIIEIVILSFFLLEIFMRGFSFGFKKYFSDKLNVADMLIIAISLALVIVDIFIDQTTFNVVSKILRAFFRLFRIFLLFRKVTLFKIVKRNYSKFNVKTPVEKCLEILSNSTQQIDERNLLTDLEWCMEMISSNKLYDPLFDLNKGSGDVTHNNEALTWIASYSNQQNSNIRSPNKKRSSLSMFDPSKRPQAHLKTYFNPEKNNTKELMANNIEIESKLKESHELEFNSFEFQKLANGEGLSIMLDYVFDEYGLYETLCIDENKLRCFSRKIEMGYLNNPYHNKTHALDVCQTIHFFLKKCRFQELAELSPLEIASMLLAASIHDYEHPGFTNMFLIITRNDIALRYNDKSVLENHHVASSWLLTIQDEKCDIFSNLKGEDYKLIRQRMISMVLSTDMSAHFGDLAKTKARVASQELDIKDKDKNACMDQLLHAADISNPIKPFDIYYEWTDRILTEYWNQGDKERELDLPVSYLMDRYTVNTSKSQIGFIDVIVKPLYEVIKCFLPDLEKLLVNLEKNKEIWQSRIPFYDEKLAILATQREEKEVEAKK